MEILGRPYVFGDPEQTRYIQRLYRKEDLQSKIINGLQQAFEAIDEYVYEFTSDKELQQTIEDAISKILYISGLEYDESLENESLEGQLTIKWHHIPEGCRPKYLPTDIARMLKDKMEYDGLSLKDLSWELNIGTERLNKILNGKAILIAKETKAIAEYLNTTFEELTTLIPIKS